MEEGFSLKKFQVTIRFEMDDEFMTLVPAHRSYINSLIENGIIDRTLFRWEASESGLLYPLKMK
jgi:hypothetical protein